MSMISKIRRELRTLKLLGKTKRLLDTLSLHGGDTTVDRIEAQVDRAPNGVAILFEDRSVTYRELERRANRVAHWANGEGLGRGDVVALLMENRPEFLFTWIGLAKTGAEIALLNTNLSGQSLAHALAVAGARAVIVGAELIDEYATAHDHISKPAPVWVLGGGAKGHRRLDDVLASTSEERPPSAWRTGLTTGDNLFYIYTSGTTGLPKAARFSHYRFLQIGAAYTAIAGITSDDVIYCTLPLYHTAGGVIAVAIALLNGATLALRRKFSASAFWEDCRTYGATVVHYIGELCRYLVNRDPSPDDRDHRVRAAIGNGLRPDIWEHFQQRFGIRDIFEFYGATEGNFALLNIDNKAGAVGRVPPYLKRMFPVELVRFDVETESHPRGPDGFCIRCRPGEVGEAIGHIPAKESKVPVGRFEGYTDSSASEKKILRDVFERGDSYYRTGDLLSRDREGYYYFVDRIGDTFRWKGENVATSEVAEILSVYDGIKEANVYGVRIPGADGRAGMAALVCGDGLDFKGFYRYVDERLPSYARPLFLRIEEEIAITGTFKHRKVDLVREGFDITAVSEPLYFRDDASATFVPIDTELYRRLTAGEISV